MPTVSRNEGIDAEHRAVLVVDQAGWHAGADLVLPEGIDLVFLPPASPEVPPAERLWTLVVERCRRFEALAIRQVTRRRIERSAFPCVTHPTRYVGL